MRLTTERLPDHYKWGEFVRIGPNIYRVIFSIGKHHILGRKLWK